MNFWKASFFTFLSVGGRAVASLLVSKLFALQFGAAGVSLLSHFQNLLNIFLLPLTEGVNRGLLRFWSIRQHSREEKAAYFRAGVLLNLLWALATGGTLVLGAAFLKEQFGLRDTYLLWAGGVACFLVAQFGNFFGLSFLLATDKVRSYAILNALSGFTALGLLWIFRRPTLGESLLVYHAGSSLAFVFTFLWAGRFWLRDDWFRGFWSLPFPGAAVRALLSFVLVAVSGSLFEKLVWFVLRALALAQFSEEAVGHWQAVVRLSDSYTMLFSATFLTVFFPKVSALIAEPEACRKYLHHIFFRLAPPTVLFLTGVFAFREPLLELLFSPDFRPAERWVHYVVVGDFFRLLQYFLASLLLAAGSIRLYILLQLAFNGIYLLSAGAAIYLGWLEGVLLSLLISYLMAAFSLLFFTRKWLWKVPRQTDQ